MSDDQSDKKAPQSFAVVLPLLGAGAKAVPVTAAARIAAESCASWRPPKTTTLDVTDGPDDSAVISRRGSRGEKPAVRLALLFGVQEDEIAGEVEDQFDRCPEWTEQGPTWDPT